MLVAVIFYMLVTVIYRYFFVSIFLKIYIEPLANNIIK